MKKFLALLLALVMVFALAACGEGETTATPTPGSQSEEPSGDGEVTGDPVTIEMWPFNIGAFTDAAAWDEIIAAFNEEYPNITVVVNPVNYQDGDQRLTTADGVRNVSQLDGTYYMYPLSLATHCMAINYEVFEAADALQYIDDETRTWTTDDFVAAMAAVRDAAAAGTVNVATPGIIYCGAQGGDQGTRALVNNLYSDYFVTEDGSSYNANSANNVKALELLQSMVADGSLSANASFQASDELQAFANQTCAVTFCWNYSNYNQYASQTQFTPYAVAFPSDDGTPELEMAGPYGFCVFDNGDDARAEAAKTFIKFVCDDAETGVLAAQTTGFFPVHADWGDIYADAEDADIRAPFSLMGNYVGRYYNLTGGWTEQRSLWWPLLTDIMLNGADVQTAADAYVEAANANIG